MFTSSTTTTSDYSILECPQQQQQQQMSIMPLVMEMSNTKWKCNNIEIAPNCPRCASTNTKFCYYNNYSLSQPRYFCKACRRYWTKGGSLRNVPVGGGCRKSRRARAAATRQGGVGPTLPGPEEELNSSGNNNSNNTCVIDMAAVYAKYVNQNAGVEESFSPGGASSGSSSIDSQIEDVVTTMFEVPINMQQQQQQGIMPHDQFSGMDGQDYVVYQDFNAFDHHQVMIGEENVLWSEEGTTLPGYGSQQVQPTMQQVQDFGLISPDDNWASFDLSAIEF